MKRNQLILSAICILLSSVGMANKPKPISATEHHLCEDAETLCDLVACRKPFNMIRFAAQIFVTMSEPQFQQLKETIIAFNRKLQALCSQHNIGFVPAFKPFLAFGRPRRERFCRYSNVPSLEGAEKLTQIFQHALSQANDKVYVELACRGK